MITLRLSWRRWLTGVLLSLWLGLLFGAAALIWRYKETPGEASALHRWPKTSRLALAAETPTLLFFAHPHCPCTRAGLHELRGLMSRFSGRVKAHVIFLHPNGTPANWIETDTWRDAASIPGLVLLDDTEGREAALFEAKTSGQVYLFSASGALLFNSGITIARGHEGSSPQREALIALLDARPAPDVHQNTVTGPVYGCQLLEPP